MPRDFVGGHTQGDGAWELCSQTNVTIRNGHLCKQRGPTSILNTLPALPCHQHIRQGLHFTRTRTKCVGWWDLKSSPCSVHWTVCPSRRLHLPGAASLSNLLKSIVRALSMHGHLHMAFWAAASRCAVSVVSSPFQSHSFPRLAFPPLRWLTAPHLFIMSSGYAKCIAQGGLSLWSGQARDWVCMGQPRAGAFGSLGFGFFSHNNRQLRGAFFQVCAPRRLWLGRRSPSVGLARLWGLVGPE